MKRDVTVILIARTGSKRCPRKVIKPFINETSLFELMCKELKKIDYPIAAAVGDDELIEIANRLDVPILHRTKEEVTIATPLVKVFKCVEQCKTSHAMLVSPCTPFLTAETINTSCRVFCESEEWMSMSAIIKEQNWFFDENRKPLVPINVQNMTTNELCVYAMANAYDIFPVDRFMKDGIFYTFDSLNDPYLYEIPKNEAFDIDDPEDFELGQHMYEKKMKQNKINV
jgi:CMP-N-acetylneuraminic acid synthetase